MKLSFLTKDFQITSKKFVASTILTSGTLAWFFVVQVPLFNMSFQNYPNTLVPYLGPVLFYTFGAFSAVIGSLLGQKINSRKLLLFWITLGIIATASLAVSNELVAILSIILLGFSLGLGLPCCMAFVTQYTTVEERARVSGIVILQTFIMAFIATAVVTMLGIGLLGVIIISIAVRATSYLALAVDDCVRPQGKERSWSKVVVNKEFASYLLPWIIFNVVGSIAWWMIPSTSAYASFVAIGTAVRLACVAIFGLVAGVAADYFGRKQSIIIGLIVLGISFELLGLAPSPTTVLIYLIMSGIVWGSFLAVYLAVPGDLAFSGSEEKFYALGAVVPLIIELGISSITTIHLSPSQLSPILGITLFLSIIPVLRARETLPEKKMEDRRFKEHLDRVGKLVKESKERS